MLTYDDSFCAGSNIFTSEEIEALPYKWLPNRQARDLHIFWRPKLPPLYPIIQCSGYRMVQWRLLRYSMYMLERPRCFLHLDRWPSRSRTRPMTQRGTGYKLPCLCYGHTDPLGLKPRYLASSSDDHLIRQPSSPKGTLPALSSWLWSWPLRMSLPSSLSDVGTPPLMMRKQTTHLNFLSSHLFGKPWRQ